MGPITTRVLTELRTTEGVGVTDDDLQAVGVAQPRRHVNELRRAGYTIALEPERVDHMRWTTRYVLLREPARTRQLALV